MSPTIFGITFIQRLDMRMPVPGQMLQTATLSTTVGSLGFTYTFSRHNSEPLLVTDLGMNVLVQGDMMNVSLARHP